MKEEKEMCKFCGSIEYELILKNNCCDNCPDAYMLPKDFSKEVDDDGKFYYYRELEHSATCVSDIEYLLDEYGEE